MKKKYFALLLVVLSFEAFSQTFTWGNPFGSLNEDESAVSHYATNSIHHVTVRYNNKIFNKEIFINNLSLSNLDRLKALDLSTAQPVMGLATTTNLELFQEKSTNFILFVDDFNTKTKERELYFQRINIETGTKSELTLITKMPTRNSSYFVVQSENKEFYAVIKQHSIDKKANEKLHTVVLDKNCKVVNEISFETPYMNKNPYEQKHFVSNQGNVFFVKEIDLAKEKPFKTVFYWDRTKTSMSETSLKFDNDFQIHQFKGHFFQDDFYIHGLFTRIGSKAVQAYGGNKPCNGFIVVKFNTQGEKVYLERSEIAETAGLMVKDFVFDGLKTWFFGDRMFENKKSKPPVPGQMSSFEYNYTYSNDAIVFGKLDNEIGKLEWFKNIPFSEDNTMNDRGRFLSYLFFIRNNQLIILYNDTQKTMLGKRTFEDRFIAMETFDDRGNAISKSLIPDNGLELKYKSEYHGTLEENFDLDTTVNLPLKDGVYLVKAKSPTNEKYGYLKF